jgi:hypothetical protein
MIYWKKNANVKSVSYNVVFNLMFKRRPGAGAACHVIAPIP